MNYVWKKKDLLRSCLSSLEVFTLYNTLFLPKQSNQIFKAVIIENCFETYKNVTSVLFVFLLFISFLFSKKQTFAYYWSKSNCRECTCQLQIGS